jgi:hypothetical protein
MSWTLAPQLDFLTRTADKALGTGILIRPRVRSVFEPPPQQQQQQQQQRIWIGPGPDWPEEAAARVETALSRQPHEPPELAGPNGPPPQGSVPVASVRNDGPPVAPAAAEEPLATRRRDTAAGAQPARSVESAAATLHDGAAAIRSLRPQQQSAATTKSRPDASSRPVARNNQTSTDHLAPAVVATPSPAARPDETAPVPPAATNLGPPATPALPPRRAQHTAMEEYRRPHPGFADEPAQAVLVPAADARVLFVVSSLPHRAQPEAWRGEQPEAPAAPVVNVTIGRVEVRAASAPAPPGLRAARGQQPLSLDEYLKRRSGR